ncbi:unnamed protein product [Taenia asiatica]|uniref:Uridylate-specific endoribonuclease n=1 Tax=Taenia asiatica TaxID=60517 RepID=A0A0R3WEZ3_TAEAS|nr:unnamed protein product [Taenia asiatica]
MRIGRSRAFLWLAVFFGLALLVESRKSRGKDPDFEKLVNKLWELDVNRLQINKDLVLNLQGFVTKPPEDKAPEPLFTFVNGTRLYSTPTFRGNLLLSTYQRSVNSCLFGANLQTSLYLVSAARFFHLLAFIELRKFYNPNVLVVEITSPQKVQSQMAFLDAILSTPVMVEVRRYLEEKKLASPIDEEFKEMLGHLWFTGIMRKKCASRQCYSCLCYHFSFCRIEVEVERIAKRQSDVTAPSVVGNPVPNRAAAAISVATAVCASFSGGGGGGGGGVLTFGGHSRNGLKNLLSVAFKWNSDWMKDYATFLIGTSPEFEMGVYTAAFLTMNSIWPDGFRYALSLRLNQSRLVIQCYRNAKATLASCYIV